MSRAKKQHRLRLHSLNATRPFEGRRNGTGLQSAARIRVPFVFFVVLYRGSACRGIVLPSTRAPCWNLEVHNG